MGGNELPTQLKEVKTHARLHLVDSLAGTQPLQL